MQSQTVKAGEDAMRASTTIHYSFYFDELISQAVMVVMVVMDWFSLSTFYSIEQHLVIYLVENLPCVWCSS